MQEESDQRDDGSLQIIVAVHAHGVGVHLPTVGGTRERRDFGVHRLQSVGRATIDGRADRLGKLFHVERLTGLKPYPLHACDC